MILTQLIFLSYSNYNLVPVHAMAQAYVEQYNICFDCDCPLPGDFVHSQPTMVHSLLSQLPCGFIHSQPTMVHSLLSQLPGGFIHNQPTMVHTSESTNWWVHTQPAHHGSHPGVFTHSHSSMVHSLLSQVHGGFTHSHSTMVHSWQPATGSSYWQC